MELLPRQGAKGRAQVVRRVPCRVTKISPVLSKDLAGARCPIDAASMRWKWQMLLARRTAAERRHSS
jgi:hypothetical protein